MLRKCQAGVDQQRDITQRVWRKADNVQRDTIEQGEERHAAFDRRLHQLLFVRVEQLETRLAALELEMID